jgi:hypothetical protein
MASARHSKWLCTSAALPPIAAILTIILAPDPHGHWSGHLWLAYLDAAQLVLLVVMATLVAAMLGWRTFSVLLMLAVAVIAVGIIFQVIGNYQVAESIWATSGNPGFGEGYNEGHDRAASGDFLVVFGGATFALIVGAARRVPVKIAGFALVMVIIPPPFVWPAAGVLMLMLYGLVAADGFDLRPVAAGGTEKIASSD